MQHTKRIIGLEHELNVIFADSKGNPLGRENSEGKYLRELFRIIRSMTAVSSLNSWKSTHDDEEEQVCTLRNGGIVYIDSGVGGPGVLEICTPECLTPLEVVLYDKAIDVFLNQVIERWNSLRSKEKLPRLYLFKKNTGIMPSLETTRFCTLVSQLPSRGFHESYLISSDLFERLQYTTIHSCSWALFLLVRYLVAGSGGIVGEADPGGRDFSFGFAISPRFCSMGEIISSETTNPDSRALIHAFSGKIDLVADDLPYRRLHVICGDANMMEKSTWLTVGMGSLVLEAMENGYLDERLALNGKSFDDDTPPFSEFLKRLSMDHTGKAVKIPLQGDSFPTALEILYRFHEFAESYARRNNRDCHFPLLQEWKRVLDAIDRDWQELVGVLGWPTLKWMLEGFRKGIRAYSSGAAHMLNFDFHNVDFRKSEYYRNIRYFERVLSDGEIRKAARRAPQTRARIRAAVHYRLDELNIPYDFSWKQIFFEDKLEDQRDYIIDLGNPFVWNVSQLDRKGKAALAALKLTKILA